MSNVKLTDTELDALAHEIALSTVKSDIESFCPPVHVSGSKFGRWYDVDSLGGDAGKFQALLVQNAVKYLDAKGLLERHPDSPNLVRVMTRAKAREKAREKGHA